MQVLWAFGKGAPQVSYFKKDDKDQLIAIFSTIDLKYELGYNVVTVKVRFSDNLDIVAPRDRPSPPTY